MSYAVERDVFGKKVWIDIPCGEYITDGRHEFSCNIWPDRVSDCYIDGRRVSPLVYQRARKAKHRPYPLTPHNFRVRLRMHVRPLETG